MKEVKMYQCEMCNETYHDIQKAYECEKLGKEIPLANVGDMVEYKVRVGGGFDPFYVDMRISEIKDKGHYITYYFEEYDEDENEWYESEYCPIGVWGNEQFEDLCKLK